MKSKTFTAKILLLLTAVILCGSNTSLAQTKKKPQKQKQETSREKFYRKGGKETKAKIIVQDWELTTSDIAENRDITLYDNGGHFNCRNGYVLFEGESESNLKSNCDIPKLRDFIWQHWQNKSKGYVRVSFNSVDAVSTSHIFVEPDKNGKWHIAWRIVRHLGEITDVPNITVLEQTKSEKSDKEGGTFVLVFKDDEDDEIQRL